MRKSAYHFTLVLFIVMASILSAFSLSHAKDTEGAETGAEEFAQVVELEREVHFLTPTGEDTVVPPGAYTVEAGDAELRLIPDDEQKTQPITIQAEATTHEESLDTARPVSTSMDGDQHVVALLLPDGKAMQAIGSYSGVRTRGFKPKPGFLKGITLPTINGILTTPKFGILQVGGIAIIKGKNFGAFREGPNVGKVLIYGRFKHNVPTTVLQVQEWSPTRIKVEVQSNSLETQVKDQSVKLQIKTAKGTPSVSWKIPFRAARETQWLNFTDKVVQVLRCSKDANLSSCNGREHFDLPVLFAGPCNDALRPPTWKGRKATIWAMHRNCNMDEDWDKGSDRYAITLQNGWVFKTIWLNQRKSSPKEWIMMPHYETLKKSVLGTSSWKPTIKWMISPSDHIRYHYFVQIEGPRGIPYD